MNPVVDPEEGPGGPPYCYTKLSHEGLKKIFLDTSPPPPAYLMIWMTRPLCYLKVWICHWNSCFLDSKIQI